MRFLATEKLSEHKYKTPEGYLVCVDAILSRTGKQRYIRSELFGDSCENPTNEVEVDRLEDDVFNESAMASFENKPICIEHPNEDVNVANHNELSVGFVRDIKRGIDNGQPVMMGTLVITDENAIRLIENGEYTELSCGYDCDIVDDEHPIQRNIRGNHVALCQHGRAGNARIVDSANDDLYGLIKEPVKRYYLAKKYDKKWDIEENIVIIAKNISEAEQKLKRRFPDAYNLREISHSEYLKFRRGNVIIDSVNDDTLVSANKLKVGMRINYRGTIYTVEAITPNKLYGGEVDLTLKADNGSIRVLETGEFYRFSVVNGVNDMQDYMPEYVIWVKKNGQWITYGASSSATINKNEFLKLGYEDVRVTKNGEVVKDSPVGRQIETQNRKILMFRNTNKFNDLKSEVDKLQNKALSSNERTMIENRIKRIVQELKEDYEADMNDVKNNRVDATEQAVKAHYRKANPYITQSGLNISKICDEESDMIKDISNTNAPGTDKIIYVMQSDVDKNLYFYIGKTFSMKEGMWGYSKFKMDETTPEELKSDLLRHGWHQVSQGVAKIIDVNHNIAANELISDESRQTLIEKLRTISVPYGERYTLSSNSGWSIDIQHHGKATYENINKYSHVSPKESSEATIRLWYNGKHMNTFTGPLNKAKSEAIAYLQSRTEDSIKDSVKSKLFTISFKKNDIMHIRKIRAASFEDAIKHVKDKYNKYANETNKEFLQSAISEISRYIRMWNSMSNKERRNIAPEGGLLELKQDLAFAKKRLEEIS